MTRTVLTGRAVRVCCGGAGDTMLVADNIAKVYFGNPDDYTVVRSRRPVPWCGDTSSLSSSL